YENNIRTRSPGVCGETFRGESAQDDGDHNSRPKGRPYLHRAAAHLQLQWKQFEFCGPLQHTLRSPIILAMTNLSKSRSIILLLGTVFLATRALSGTPPQLETGFTFNGKPVHPLLIKQFEPWVSDPRPPITVELNLTAASDSNQYAADFKTGSDGLVSINL